MVLTAGQLATWDEQTMLVLDQQRIYSGMLSHFHNDLKWHKYFDMDYTPCSKMSNTKE